MAIERVPCIVDPANRLVLAEQLECLGVSADIRESSECGLEAFRVGDYAVVFLDCQLPDMDGYETASQIRAHEATEGLPRVPIIAISADGGIDHKARCMRAGMDFVLTKPLGLTELHDVLKVWAHMDISIAAPTSNSKVQLRDAFISSTITDVTELEHAIEKGDYKRCAALAHRIKGSALTFGAQELAELARQLELATQDEAHQRVSPLVAQLRNALKRADIGT